MNWDIVKNPYVIAAGVGIGALILLTRGSGGGSSNDQAVALDAFSRNNAMAMQLAGQVAGLQVDQNMALSRDTTQTVIAAMGNLTALAGARAQVQAQWDEAHFGMAMDRERNAAAYRLEALQGNNRFRQAQLEKSTILESLMIEAGRNPGAYADQPEKATRAHSSEKPSKVTRWQKTADDVSNSWKA